MTPRPRTPGRAGTPIIPTGWEAHHRGVPDGAATATVTITRPTAGTWDDDEHRTVPGTPTTVWTGPARVQQLTAAATPTVGEQQQTTRHYLVVVPLDCPPVLIGDAVDVDTATEIQAETLALRVVDVPTGSLLWERDLECEHREPQD